MFENVGKEIKRLAEKYVISAMVPFVIIAIAVFAVLAYMGYALVGLLAAVIIVLVKYSSVKREVILLYGYGELIDRVQSIEEHIVPSKGNNQKVIKKVPVKIDIDVPKTKRNANGTWNCVFCEEENEADAKWCKNCNIEARFD